MMTAEDFLTIFGVDTVTMLLAHVTHTSSVASRYLEYWGPGWAGVPYFKYYFGVLEVLGPGPGRGTQWMITW